MCSACADRDAHCVRDGIAEGTFLLRGGYKPDLTTAEVRDILQQSL